MTTSKSLPARPSLESLRKQAKRLARDIAAGGAGAIARARAQLPRVDLPSTLRHAQLVIAREYGYSSWQDLIAEVSKRLGNDLEWAVKEARRIIHDNNVERLKQLVAAHPELLSWHGDDDDGGLLGMAANAYGDAGDPEREAYFTRADCAELLIDAGAVVTPSVCQGLLESRARVLLRLFHRRGLLPGTLEFLTALGDLDAVRRALDENDHDLATVNAAFVCACRFQHEAVASLLLERSIAMDPELARQIDGSVGRDAFTVHFISHFTGQGRSHAPGSGLWLAFVMDGISRSANAGDVVGLVRGLRREPRLLGADLMPFQVALVEAAAVNDRADIVTALLELEPAILRRQPPPSQAIEHAFTYANSHLIPLLTRIWPLPDDLAHAAGMGDLSRVKRWFDAEGRPALGDVANHAPATSVHPREPQWGEVGVQQVLDTALAWSVINRHFDVADFLLEHGANVSTNWNSHEPASILHHLVFLRNPYEPMRFLVDRGIDMTIRDYRWNSTAHGWALHAKKDHEMAKWLQEVERERDRESP